MSIPGDQHSYDYNILSNLSENLTVVKESQHPTLKEVTIENFVLRQLASAKNAGMLPGTLVDEIEESIQHLKAKLISEITPEELESVQSALKKGPSDSDSGYVGSSSDSLMLSEAKKTMSWAQVLFPTQSPFLPVFSQVPSNPSPDVSQAPSNPFRGLSKQDADLLHKVLQENGYSTIADYMEVFSAAKRACPTVYEFRQDQLARINTCLQPTVLASSLQRREGSKFPIQFEKDNINGQRMTWLTLTINGQKCQLDTQERIQQSIEQLTQVAQNLSPEHSEFLRDCLLLMASQTLVNPLQEGKNDLAIRIVETTGAAVVGSILPSNFSIKDIKSSVTGCSFTCDVEYNYSYKLNLSATDEDQKALNPLLKKQGMEDIFSGTIRAQFIATLNYSSEGNTFSLHLPQLPSVTVIK